MCGGWFLEGPVQEGGNAEGLQDRNPVNAEFTAGVCVSLQ